MEQSQEVRRSQDVLLANPSSMKKKEWTRLKTETNRQTGEICAQEKVLM